MRLRASCHRNSLYGAECYVVGRQRREPHRTASPTRGHIEPDQRTVVGLSSSGNEAFNLVANGPLCGPAIVRAGGRDGILGNRDIQERLLCICRSTDRNSAFGIA